MNMSRKRDATYFLCKIVKLLRKIGTATDVNEIKANRVSEN